MTEMRPYQTKGINMLFEAFKRGVNKVALVLAMGLGKTTLMGKVIEVGFQNGRNILVVVHRDNLVRQFAERLRDQFNVPSGLILGGEPKRYSMQVQIASRQSLSRRLENFNTDHFHLIVIDEAHYALGDEYKKIINYFQNYKLVGITATPFRNDGKPMGDLFEEMIHPITAKQAIAQGYLCGARYFGVGNIDMSGVSVKKGDYDENEMFDKFSKFNITPEVIKHYGMSYSGNQTIVFCINVAHTLEVYEAFNKKGFSVDFVTGSTPVQDRNLIYRKFKNKEIEVLVNCEILTEGADFPEIVNVFLVRKTKSLARYLQMVGRGLRTSINKQHAVVVDFGGNVIEHGYFEDYDEGLTLQKGAATKLQQRKPRRCPSCDEIIMGKKCEECGFEFTPTETTEKININGLELIVLNENIVTYKRLSRKKLDDVKDHELRMFAKVKGCKPAWAYHIYADRHKVIKDDGGSWMFPILNELKKIEKENGIIYESNTATKVAQLGN